MSEQDAEVGLGEREPPDRGRHQLYGRRWMKRILQRKETPDHQPRTPSPHATSESDHSSTHSSSLESSDDSSDTSDFDTSEFDTSDEYDTEVTSSSEDSDEAEPVNQTTDVKAMECDKFFKLVEHKDVTKLKDFLDELGHSEKKALCEATNEKGLTALQLAASWGILAMCQLLHQTGADLNARSANKPGKTPIILAAEKKTRSHWECVDWILKTRKESEIPSEPVKPVNQESESPSLTDIDSDKEMEMLVKSSWFKEKHKQLCKISKKHNRESPSIINEVIELLADLPKPLVKTLTNMTGENGNTVLHYAAQRGDTDLCKLLFKEGAVLNAKGKENLTPSEFAVRYGSQTPAVKIWEAIKWMTEERQRQKRETMRGQGRENAQEEIREQRFNQAKEETNKNDKKKPKEKKEEKDRDETERNTEEAGFRKKEGGNKSEGDVEIGEDGRERYYIELLQSAAIAGNLRLCELLYENATKQHLEGQDKLQKKLLQSLMEQESKRNRSCIDWILSKSKGDMQKGDLRILLKSKWFKEKTRLFIRYVKEEANSTGDRTGQQENQTTGHKEPSNTFNRFLPPFWPEELKKSIIQAKDGFCNTALHYAARTANANLCELLIDMGANAEAKGENKLSPLEFAARFGVQEFSSAAWEKISRILEKSSWTILKKSGLTSSLQYALQNPNWVKNTEVIEKLIDSKNVDILATDEDGNNCVHLAVKLNQQAGHGLLETLLLQGNVKKNLKTLLPGINRFTESPFYVAVRNSNHTSLEILCKHAKDNGLDLSSLLHQKPAGKDRRLTPLQLAIKEDNFYVLDVLMKYDLADVTEAKSHMDITK